MSPPLAPEQSMNAPAGPAPEQTAPLPSIAASMLVVLA